MSMPLWLLVQKARADFDEMHGCIIGAANEERARLLAQAKGVNEIRGPWDEEKGAPSEIGFWTDPEKTECTLLAEASTVTDEGVVLRDVHWG